MQTAEPSHSNNIEQFAIEPSNSLIFIIGNTTDIRAVMPHNCCSMKLCSIRAVTKCISSAGDGLQSRASSTTVYAKNGVHYYI